MLLNERYFYLDCGSAAECSLSRLIYLMFKIITMTQSVQRMSSAKLVLSGLDLKGGGIFNGFYVSSARKIAQNDKKMWPSCQI
jgi:hypothetical protein